MKCLSESCVNGCEMAWYEKCAMKLLQLNSISRSIFADAMRDLLQSEKGKFCNIMTVGPEIVARHSC